MFAVAQEESATKSENIKFGIHQRMREGKALLNHTRFLGYTKDAEGQLVIVPEEAEIVRKIFSLYLEGNGVRKIKRYLEEHGIRTVTGKAEWSTSTIDRMLSNEKYMGILLLQKTYTPDFLTGKQKKNRGELSMYMIEDAHEAIIEKEVFEAVQKKSGGAPLASEIRLFHTCTLYIFIRYKRNSSAFSKMFSKTSFKVFIPTSNLRAVLL